MYLTSHLAGDLIRPFMLPVTADPSVLLRRTYPTTGSLAALAFN